MPLVSVVMGAFNAADYLEEAIASILGQSLADLELIVIDDGSTDATPAILAAQTDPRLRVIRNPFNMGVAHTANVGLVAARAPLIARMDADDIAAPDRLERQVAFLNAHPEVTVCGGHMEKFGKLTGTAALPTDDATIKANLLPAAGNIMNPTAMFRRDFVEAHRLRANPALSGGSDYAFWVDCMLAGATFANLPEVLIRYRWHGNNISARPKAAKPGIRRYRRSVALAYFPHLTGVEIDALLLLFEPAQNVPREMVEAVRLAAAKAKSDPWSRFGEDRARLGRYLDQGVGRLVAAQAE